ncbi:hypothetical protein [Nocardioides nematodiphilus]|uniref:hypothetical protein n=1 Tax=Nocardioides nematodiphilus TaxID=2849669 RepID=UPI001CD95EA9|nr:hypothetical protein [Nocardioides nematodiphilus]MCA1982647.1 hypothetical protein [Nocardioides nematodiphilus]
MGERSAHNRFVLHEQLDLPDVRNHDGSWGEDGSLLGAPIEVREAVGWHHPAGPWQSGA